MTIVVKIGGARAVDPGNAVDDVATLVAGQTDQDHDPESGAGPRDVVVAHGGSTTVDETLERLGLEPEYVETPGGVTGRFTDEATMEVFEMCLPGVLNTELVATLRSAGVDAVGLSGVDGGLLSGPRKSALRVLEDGTKKIRRGDHSGSLQAVDAELLETLLAAGHTPVVSPPMAGEEDDGTVTPVNVDADRTAAAIAAALDATLVFLTDVPGVLDDPGDRDSLIREADSPEDWERLQTAAEGGMGRKLMAAREALESGSPEVVVADGTLETPIFTALEGDGTHVFPGALEGIEEEWSA